MPYTPDLSDVFVQGGIPATVAKDLEDRLVVASANGAPSVSGRSVQLAQRQMPRLGVIGTSITETLPYRSALSATDNGDGTWAILFSSSARTEYGEGEIVQVSQGPLGVNTRSAEITAISGNTLTVRPDTTKALPLVGTTPLVYHSLNLSFGSYIGWAQNLAAASFDISVDASLGGADTAQLNTLIDRDLISRASEFDFVIAEIGSMNGVYARSNSYDTELALVKIMVDKIAALGKPFMIVGVLPRGSASPAWSSGKVDIVVNLHKYLAAYVPTIGGSFFDPYKATLGNKSYLDTSSATGDPKITEATTDGVHVNSGGGLILGASVAKWVDSIFPPSDFLPSSIRDSAIGLINTNPFMNGTGGAKTGGVGASVTGTVADSCDLVVTAGGADCSVVCSIVARTEGVHGDAIGNAQRLVITTGATASTIIELRLSGNLSASVTNGDFTRAMAAVTASNGSTPGSGVPVGLASTNVFAVMQTSITVNKFIGSNGAGTAAVNQEAYKARVRTQRSAVRSPASIHGTPASVRFGVTIYVRANSNICIDVGRAGFFKG